MNGTRKILDFMVEWSAIVPVTSALREVKLFWSSYDLQFLCRFWVCSETSVNSGASLMGGVTVV